MRTVAIVRTLIIAGSLVVTAACASSGGQKRSDSSVGTATAVAATAATKCQYGAGTYRKVHVDEFAGMCMAPRKEPADNVRIPLKADVFVSDCAIKLGVVDQPVSTDVCAPTNTNTKPAALSSGDRMLITKNAAGEYLLTRLRGSDLITFSLTGKGSHENGTSFLSGDHDGVTYVVYIQNDVADAQGNFDKFYRFEAFDSDVNNPTQCATHKPVDPSIVRCATGAGTLGSQTGTSTGGEPPVK
jgi:hypothetical protein